MCSFSFAFKVGVALVCLSFGKLSIADHRSILASVVKERVKRATDKQNTNVAGFDATERDNIVNKHNEFRRGVSPTAANMLYMTWDSELAALAQGWAEQCDFNHRPSGERRISSQPDTPVGENLDVGQTNYNEDTTVTRWHSEESDYDFNANSCSASACGHYTQVVWANSEKVGCGIKFCPTVQNLNFGDAYVVVCNYLPSGNYVGEKPYVSGASCSQCPAGKTCDNKLCRDSTTTASTTSNTGNTGSGNGVTTSTQATTTSRAALSTSHALFVFCFSLIVGLYFV